MVQLGASKRLHVDSAGEEEEGVMFTCSPIGVSFLVREIFAEINTFHSAYKAVTFFPCSQRIEMWAQKQINYPLTTESYLVRKQKAFTSYTIDASCDKCDSYGFVSYLSSCSIHKSVSHL